MTFYMQKFKISLDFFPEILMTKKSCNPIGQEAQLATPNQKW